MLYPRAEFPPDQFNIEHGTALLMILYNWSVAFSRRKEKPNRQLGVVAILERCCSEVKWEWVQVVRRATTWVYMFIDYGQSLIHARTF
jgi:hypothetical protein